MSSMPAGNIIVILKFTIQMVTYKIRVKFQYNFLSLVSEITHVHYCPSLKKKTSKHQNVLFRFWIKLNAIFSPLININYCGTVVSTVYKERKIIYINFNSKMRPKRYSFPVLENMFMLVHHRSFTHLFVKFFAGLFNRLYTVLKSECATN